MAHKIGHSFRERNHRWRERDTPGNFSEETCEDVGELARELGVRPRCLYKWRRKLEMVEPGQEASRPSTHASAHRKEIHRLKQLLAEKTLEVDFFKGALQKVEARRQKRGGTGETASTSRSEK